MKQFENKKPPVVITLKRKKSWKAYQHKLDSGAREGKRQGLEDARYGKTARRPAVFCGV
jgi:hypothetical protein